jgi:hypothetical protein
MVVTESFSPARPPPGRRYVRPPQPLRFPESQEMPETGVHLELRTGLYLIVRDFVGDRGAVGSEQFVYWDPSDPRRCLAPDLVVRMATAPGPFATWKTWERGAPHLGVEIVSHFDRGDDEWNARLERYRSAGINEVVRFDPESPARPLRLWDRFDGDLVERELTGEGALHCDTLGLYWCLKEDEKLGRVLRLAKDPLGVEVLPSAEERIAALEAELGRRHHVEGSR